VFDKNSVRFSGRAKQNRDLSSASGDGYGNSSSGDGGGDASTRIIGGTRAPKGRFPYAASLETSDGSHVCGGSLVARDFVLTAAHCFDEFTYVTVGQYDRFSFDQSQETFSIADEYVHPDYYAPEFPFDYLLVKLNGASNNEPVTMNRNANIPWDRQELTVMGWGVHDALQSNAARFLTTATVNYENNDICRQSTSSEFSYKTYLTSDMLCAFDYGEDSCQGDSGGPLVSRGSSFEKDVLMGVVSWGYSCGDPTFPGVYARVSYVMEWIESVICEESDYPPDFCPDPPTVPPTPPIVVPTQPPPTPPPPTQPRPTQPRPTQPPPTAPPAPVVPPTAAAADTTWAPTSADATFPITISITFDDYPEEVGWSLRRVGSNAEVITQVDSGTYKTPRMTAVETVMVQEGGLYAFDIYDLVGDGICCKHGNGEYSIYLGTRDVNDQDKLFIRVSGEYDHDSEQYLIASHDPLEQHSGDSFLTLVVTFDAYPPENGWVLETEYMEEEDGTETTTSVSSGASAAQKSSSMDPPRRVVDYRPHGTYERSLAQKTIMEQILIPDTPKDTFRTFTFTFIDTAGDGICCQYGSGSYTLYKGSSEDGIVIVKSNASQKNQESTTFALSGEQTGTPAIVPETDDTIAPKSSAAGTYAGSTSHRWLVHSAASSLILLSLWNILLL